MEDIFLYSKTIEQFFENNQIRKEYLFRLECCPICESENSKKLFEQYGFNYLRCTNCTFVFVNPRLNDKGSFVWYNSDFYNAGLETEYNKIKSGERYSSSLGVEMFDRVSELLKKAGLSKEAEILEIGCGNGAFLEYLRNKMGFENSVGIDLNEKAIEFARDNRKLNAENINVNRMNSDSKYDLVISMESIEHSNDLNEFMKNVSGILKDKGFFLITTPYNDSKATLLGGVWGDHYMAPNHINFFNMKSLKMFLEKYGLKIHSYNILENYLGIDLLKYKLKYKRDWAISLPPKEVEEIVVIPKKETDNYRFVKVVHFGNSKKSAGAKDNNAVYNLLKKFYHGISDMFNLKWKYHFIILAQKL